MLLVSVCMYSGDEDKKQGDKEVEETEKEPKVRDFCADSYSVVTTADSARCALTNVLAWRALH